MGLALLVFACQLPSLVQSEAPAVVDPPSESSSAPIHLPDDTRTQKLPAIGFDVEVPLPAHDPVTWKIQHGLIDAAVERSLERSPAHSVGSRDSFFVRDAASESGYAEIEAELRYLNDTVAMWVERDVDLDSTALADAADRFAADVVPTIRDLFGKEWSPGVDGDPILAILHLSTIPGAVGEYSAADEYLTAVEPYSNQREMFYVSLSDFAVGDDNYMATLAHEYQHMIQWNNDRSESTWLDEGLAQVAERVLGYDTVGTDPIFLAMTDTQLNSWPANPGENLPHYGASYLFTLYLWEQFGDDLIRELARHPEDGMAAVRQSLAARGVDADVIFGDWTVANYLDNPTAGAGLYGYANETLRPACPRQHMTELPTTLNGSLPQYSAQYLTFEGSGSVELAFQGSPEVGPIPDRAARGKYYWWSNRGDNIHSTLTRAFDLTGLEGATLMYQTWHDTEPYLDNGYVSVSTDGGQTWEFQAGDQTEFDPAYDYGPNYTGLSGQGAQAGWVAERIDLGKYVGTEVLVRFEYVTLSPFSGYGWAVDDISIPEMNYWHDAESDADGWEAAGFVRTPEEVGQRWALHWIGSGEVAALAVSSDGRANGRFELREAATLVIAAMAPRTKVAAEYALEVSGDAALLGGGVEGVQAAAFRDDFSDVCSGWAIEEGAGLAYGYQEDAFSIELRAPERVAVSNAGVSFSDVAIDVHTTQQTTAGDNSWGVVCRYLDFDNYYGFEVSNDGYYTIYAFLDGEYVPLLDWKELGSISTGVGAQNRLTASCIGDTLTLSLHGHEIGSVTNDTLKAGDIGLTASTYEHGMAEVLFDNLRVTTPDYATLPGVLYYDDFDDSESGWEVDGDSESAVGYQGGKYFIEVYEDDVLAWSTANQAFGDTVLEVATRLEDATADNTWGLFCRYLDRNNQYGFEIGNDGLYAVYAVLQGEFIPLVDWTFSEAIDTGPGAQNHLRVSCIGELLSLTVNGVPLAEVRDSNLTSGDVALLAATYETGGSRVLFDNLIVREP